MIIFLVKQAKVTDAFDFEVNSIEINPYFFHYFLQQWKKKHLEPQNISNGYIVQNSKDDLDKTLGK